LIFIILFGLGNGLENSFKTFFTDDKVNTIRLYPSSTTIPYRGYESQRRIKFTNNDRVDFQEKFNSRIEDIVVRNTFYFQMKYKERANNYSIRAVSPGHQEAELTIIMKGRYLNEGDITNRKKHVVIGRLVAEDLFQDEDPIGKYILEVVIAGRLLECSRMRVVTEKKETCMFHIQVCRRFKRIMMRLIK
jgi:putative ABC transport system permease protein